MRTHWKNTLSRAVTHVVLGVAVVVAVFPVLWVVLTSLKNNLEATSGAADAFDFTPTFQNYIHLFTTPTFVSAMLTSVTMTAGATLIVACLATLGGYGFARLKVPGRKTLASIMVLTQVVPGLVLVIPLFRIVSALNMYDQVAPLILIMSGLTLPFATWLMLAFIRSSPIELEEAAVVDGANAFQLLRHIVVPINAAGIVTASIFTAISVWNSFLIPVVLGQSNAETLTVYVAQFVTYQQVEWGYLCAAAVLIVAPIVVFVLALQGPLVRGVTAGAVK